MEPAFTLTQLRYFVAVTNAGSMTAAAEHLRISQSTLSSAMTVLESTLGAQLFLRQQSRRLVLTPFGNQFRQDAAALLNHAAELTDSVRAGTDQVVGELTIGVFAPLAPTRLPAILAECERRYPDLTVTILETDLASLHNSLRTGACEISLQYSLGLPSDLTFSTLAEIPPHVIVPPHHRLAVGGGGAAIDLAELRDDPVIWLDLPLTREYFESIFRIAGITPRIRHRVSGYETVRAFVAAGHGYAMLNQRISELSAPTPAPVSFELVGDYPPIAVGLATVSGVRRTRRSDAFAEVCRTHYRPDAIA